MGLLGRGFLGVHFRLWLPLLSPLLNREGVEEHTLLTLTVVRETPKEALEGLMFASDCKTGKARGWLTESGAETATGPSANKYCESPQAV